MQRVWRRWCIDLHREPEDNSGNAVTVPAGSGVAVAVNWSGLAAAGVDTSALPASVTVSGGTSSTNFTVTATDDYLKEGLDRFDRHDHGRDGYG